MFGKNKNYPSKDQKIVPFRKGPEKRVRSKSAEPFFNFGYIPLFIKTMFWILAGIHMICFFMLDTGNTFSLYYNFGFVPSSFTHFANFSLLSLISPFSSLLLHGSWIHLMFNLLMLLTMGLYFERIFGARWTAICFVACGFAGNLCYLILSPASTIPVIGASGAINGLFAFTFLHMHDRGVMGPDISRKGALPFIILWLVLILIGGFISNDISWQSHLGGFLAGVGIFNLWKKGHIRP